MRKIVASLLTTGFLSIALGSNITSAEEVTVQKGDTLWEISQAHDTTVESLKNINHLSSNVIYPEQKLNTEKKEASGDVTVQKGDTLWGISQVHNTSVESLKDINDLTSDLIYPGQKLSVTAVATAENTASSDESSTAAETNVSGKELTVTATAYTASCEGCSGITATGINLLENPNQKVIAVDPDVIPLGSKVYVEGYGTAIAGDTGGAIDGNRIDVFIPNKDDALAWGRKTVNITILS